MSALWRQEKYTQAFELLKEARTLVTTAMISVNKEDPECYDADQAAQFLEDLIERTRQLANQEEEASRGYHEAKIAEIDRKLEEASGLSQESRRMYHTHLIAAMEHEKQKHLHYLDPAVPHPGQFEARFLLLDHDDWESLS